MIIATDRAIFPMMKAVSPEKIRTAAILNQERFFEHGVIR